MILDQHGNPLRQSVPKRRNYQAAIVNRITNDWIPSVTTGDTALKDDIQTMRSRSRQLAQDSDLVKRYLGALENNVIGADGFKLQMQARFKRGNPRVNTNRDIESEWRRWGKRVYCSYSESDHWPEMQTIILRSVARDGGIFIRKRRGRNVNEYGFALELIEVDMLDTDYIAILENGNMVFMGIEKDSRMRVQAYWLRSRHPGDMISPHTIQRQRFRVPAQDMIHYFVRERATQSIGVPWTASAMRRLHFLNRYEEAELRAAEKAAEKGGFFQSTVGEEMAGPKEVTVDANGNKQENTIMDFEADSYDELPPGMTFVPYDPQHPNQAFGDFTMSQQYGASAGLEIDFATLTGNHSQANMSSMHNGKLEIQEQYKKVQGHFCRNVCCEVFTDWLGMAMLTGRVRESFDNFEALDCPKFIGRRWKWTQPDKDVKATLLAIDGGLTSRTAVIAETTGRDRDEVDAELEADRKSAEEHGIVISTPQTKIEPVPPEEEEEEEPEVEVEEEENEEEDNA